MSSSHAWGMMTESGKASPGLVTKVRLRLRGLMRWRLMSSGKGVPVIFSAAYDRIWKAMLE